MGTFKNKYRIKSARLEGYDYSNPAWYYITICTKGMKEWFGKVENEKMILNNPGKIVEEEWLNTEKIRAKVKLDYYVVMPNHFHGIVIIEGPEPVNKKHKLIDVETHRRCVSNTNPNKKETDHRSVSTKANNLSSIILQFKSVCTKRIRKSGHKSFQWQLRFYDHIIRNEKDLHRIRKYIEENPMKWELGEDEEYSY